MGSKGGGYWGLWNCDAKAPLPWKVLVLRLSDASVSQVG